MIYLTLSRSNKFLSSCFSFSFFFLKKNLFIFFSLSLLPSPSSPPYFTAIGSLSSPLISLLLSSLLQVAITDVAPLPSFLFPPPLFSYPYCFLITSSTFFFFYVSSTIPHSCFSISSQILSSSISPCRRYRIPMNGPLSLSLSHWLPFSRSSVVIKWALI